MAAASSAISFLMSLAVPSTWYFHRTARAAKLKFPSSEGARTPGPVYRIAFCPRYHRGFRPSPTLTESTDSFLAGCAVCCLRMWDQDHIWGHMRKQQTAHPARKLSVLSVKVGLGRKPRWYRGQKAMRSTGPGVRAPSLEGTLDFAA